MKNLYSMKLKLLINFHRMKFYAIQIKSLPAKPYLTFLKRTKGYHFRRAMPFALELKHEVGVRVKLT